MIFWKRYTNDINLELQLIYNYYYYMYLDLIGVFDVLTGAIYYN